MLARGFLASLWWVCPMKDVENRVTGCVLRFYRRALRGLIDASLSIWWVLVNVAVEQEWT
jgi:hypothetical protein